MIKRKKFNSPLLQWGGLCLLALIAVAVFCDQGLKKLYELRRLESRLEAQIAFLNTENQHLIQQLDLLQDPKYLEKTVRDELGYLRPDEVIFYSPLDTPSGHPLSSDRFYSRKP